MGSFEVRTHELEAAAGRIGAVAQDLTPALKALSRVQDAGAAADSADVASALAAVVSAWGDALIGLDLGVTALAGELSAAAEHYAATDAHVGAAAAGAAQRRGKP